MNIETSLEIIAKALADIRDYLVESIPPPTNGEPQPELETVTVTVDKAPLREIAGENARGFPVWGVYGKANVSSRIIAKKGKVLKVVGDKIKGDGGTYAWPLDSSQEVDGKELPGDQRLYVLDRMVE